MRILVVEDNPHLGSLLVERLAIHGFSCELAADLNSACAFLSDATFDLVVLDLGLPDGDGLAWLQANRGKATLPPMLILTARNGLEDRVAGLDAGADDYLVKPFDVDELLARMRALMRRPGLRTHPALVVGRLKLEMATRSASIEGVPLDLSRRESDLLELLMRKAGTLVTRQYLAETLYAGATGFSPNALDAVVSRLRRKIDAAGGGGLLHTVRGIGYLLRAVGS
ncbi:response regulator transcription factor [Roseibacterium beibuensis]|uniref:response regulator n=1 Tax=[Roseibacterium] beibuensis TaxID=1193142 RepID=UPI00217CD401|nr:response regulator transcription factor [Roseibacterium beibuensis]MCS6627903.1 response regulator transcription factor [Roseibacterium beibuensis]